MDPVNFWYPIKYLKMKKKLESELVSIAHRILKLKGKEDVLRMHDEARLLYEKLSVLKFAHENFDGAIPSIGSDSSFFGMLDAAFNNKVSDNIEVEDKIYINLDDVDRDEITEPLMEKIKDLVAQMPQETQQVDVLVEQKLGETNQRSEFEDLTEDFKNIPEFEPVSKKEEVTLKKKSINDKFRRGPVTIGLNDKLAFIKHLFDGKREDYDRVLSQVNTAQTFVEVEQLIQNQVKPDYNHWEGKEEMENRFMEIIEGKFQ